MPCNYNLPGEERNIQYISISGLKNKVNDATRNYGEFINAVYESQGIDVLSSVVNYISKTNLDAFAAFAELQSLNSKQGKPYFIIETTDPFLLKRVENIEIKDFKDYVKLAIRTDATYHSDVSTRILHSMVGLVGELSEAVEIYRKYDKEGVCTSSEYEAYISELGDILWHIALYYDATEIFRDKDIDDCLGAFISDIAFKDLVICKESSLASSELTKLGFQHIVSNFKHSGHLSGFVEVILEKAAQALDAFKKHYFYKQELDHEKHVRLMSEVCVNILRWIIVTGYLESEVITYTLKEIMEVNIKKLKARYAEKFTTEESEKRNYEKESKASGLTVK